MRNIVVAIACVGVLTVALAGVASAQTPQPAQPKPAAPVQTPGGFPNVGNLKPFSAEASFMSLPGYLRYLMHQQTGQWPTYQEAVRVVRQQTGQ